MSPYGDDRLPGHDHRRRQLMAVLGAEQAQAENARMSRHVLVPLVAGAAVIVASGVGVLAAEPWADGADGTGPAGYRVPGETGIPRESARVGDPVPADVAGDALAACMRNAAAQGKNTPAPGPVGGEQSPIRTAPPSGLPTQPKPAPGTTTPPLSAPPANSSPEGKPSGSSTAPLMPPPPDSPTVTDGSLPPPHVGRPPEKASAYRPILTTWIDDGAGGLTPFVIGKAHGPGTVACAGEAERSYPVHLYLDERGAADTYPGIGENEFPSVKPGAVDPTDPSSVTSVTFWGYADPEIARVEVTSAGGPTVEAEVRNGVWAVNGPFAYAVAEGRRTEIRAYDAQGTVLVQGGRGGPVNAVPTAP
ncbi:hypothetical protein [Streptodolium elevatio]|uniref:Uncharacterized protein n=1 Tax=Streptodolium elevatio TaxID=3157996 RepID=A0ABV3DAH4_9ACTN